jgi:2'-5' RNA ligase
VAEPAAPGSQRLFLALEIPEPLRRELHAVLEPWRRPLVGARWVPLENWHVTLLFLGATDPGRIEWVSERVASVAARAEPVPTALERLGGFPSSSRARLIWAGLQDRAGHMATLARSMRAAVAFEPEDRPFAAHVTVARSDPPQRLADAFTSAALPSAPFTVREAILFRSRLGHPAPRYEPLARFPLGPSP